MVGGYEQEREKKSGTEREREKVLKELREEGQEESCDPRFLFVSAML